MTKIIKKTDSSLSNENERRRSTRRPIITTFSIFVVIPKKGLYKLEVQNISEDGISFDVDIDGESSSDFPIQVTDSIDIKFYLNQSLYIPLSIQVARIDNTSSTRRVGAEFKNKSSPNYNAFLDLLHLLDSITHIVQID